MTSFFAKAQNIDGKWRGTFIMYVHNVFEVEMDLKKLPGDIFTAQLKITDGTYKGTYQISGNICNKSNLEITAIILLKETGGSNWIDCLNGTWDLSEDENVLSFVDNWKTASKGNYSKCKIRFVQSDMFQCLKSAYLYKVNYEQQINAFDNLWNKYDKLAKEKPEKVKETYIVEKTEAKKPVIATYKQVANRVVEAKNSIEVSNKTITIEYWDRFNIDGDSISLYLNDEPILKDVELTGTKKSITVDLQEGENFLILHALNLGKEPPNTASITIKDGKKIQNVMLYSDLEKSGALKITLKQ